MRGPKSIQELVDSFKDEYSNMNDDNLYRVLRNLSALDIFNEEIGKRFSLGRLGKQLLNTKVHRLIMNLMSPKKLV